MVRAERYALFSLIGLGAVWWFFQMRLLDGWTVVDQPPGRLFFTYILVIGLATLAEGLAAGVTRLFGRGDAVDKDERDRAIEARANQNERVFIIAAVNVVVWQLLAEGAFAGHVLPRYDLTEPSVLFFVLFSVLFFGEAVKRISTLWLYRRQSAG